MVQAAAPAGYEFYLKGRGYLLEYQKPENIDAAIKEFEQALKVSPNYAPAYAGLGEAYWHGYKADRGKEWLDKAKDELRDRRSTSIRNSPRDTFAWVTSTTTPAIRSKEALEKFQRARRFDPTMLTP